MSRATCATNRRGEWFAMAGAILDQVDIRDSGTSGWDDRTLDGQ